MDMYLLVFYDRDKVFRTYNYTNMDNARIAETSLRKDGIITGKAYIYRLEETCYPVAFKPNAR